MYIFDQTITNYFKSEVNFRKLYDINLIELKS